jgi:hypothetical protein
MTFGTYRGAHEIKLHKSNDVSIDNQVSSLLEVGSGIMIYNANGVHNVQGQCT